MPGEIILGHRTRRPQGPPPGVYPNLARRSHKPLILAPYQQPIQQAAGANLPSPAAFIGHARRPLLLHSYHQFRQRRSALPVEVPPPVRAGRSRGPRTPGPAAPAAPVLGRLHGRHFQRVPGALLQVRSRRSRVPGSGLDATAFVVGRRRPQGVHGVPVAAPLGKARRGGLAGPSQASVLRCRRKRGWPEVPAAALVAPSQRDGLAGPLQVGGMPDLGRRRARGAALMPALGTLIARPVRGGLFASGEVIGAGIVRRRQGRTRAQAPGSMAAVHRGRRLRRGLLLTPAAVAGPFWFEAMDVYAGGVDQGDIKEG